MRKEEEKKRRRDNRERIRWKIFISMEMDMKRNCLEDIVGMKVKEKGWVPEDKNQGTDQCHSVY